LDKRLSGRNPSRLGRWARKRRRLRRFSLLSDGKPLAYRNLMVKVAHGGRLSRRHHTTGGDGLLDLLGSASPGGNKYVVRQVGKRTLLNVVDRVDLLLAVGVLRRHTHAITTHAEILLLCTQ
jgi:hypothetical protein